MLKHLVQKGRKRVRNGERGKRGGGGFCCWFMVRQSGGGHPLLLQPIFENRTLSLHSPMQKFHCFFWARRFLHAWWEQRFTWHTSCWVWWMWNGFGPPWMASFSTLSLPSSFLHLPPKKERALPRKEKKSQIKTFSWLLAVFSSVVDGFYFTMQQARDGRGQKSWENRYCIVSLSKHSS